LNILDTSITENTERDINAERAQRKQIGSIASWTEKRGEKN